MQRRGIILYNISIHHVYKEKGHRPIIGYSARSMPVKSLIRNGVISGMGCQVRVGYMRRVWCAVVGEGVGGNGKYCKCSSGE